MARLVNQAGIALLTHFEGYRTQAYQDSKGVWTIGIGSTGPDIHLGLTWTDAQIHARFDTDVLRFENGVEALVGTPLTDNQFSALVCFAYNVGLGALTESHLLKKLNSGDYSGAASEFPRWDESGGHIVAGLLSRREAEQALFETPDAA
jgi:lysozyme